MEFNIPIVTSFTVGIFLWIIVGVYIKSRDLIDLEKTISVTIVTIYIFMNIYSFLVTNSKDLPLSFDILGVGAAAHLIGLRLSELKPVNTLFSKK